MTVPRRRAATDVEVVEMRPRHVRQVLAIESRVYPRPWSPTLFASELAQRDTRTYLIARARDGGRTRRIIGYGGVMVAVGEAHITTLATHPDHHRRKVGARLLCALLRTAIDRGAGAATLEVRSTNAGAQALYRSVGFAPVGVRPRYYGETGEDAVVMWLHDLTGAAARARLAAVEDSLDRPGGSGSPVDLHVPWVRGRRGLDGVPRDTGPVGEEG